MVFDLGLCSEAQQLSGAVARSYALTIPYRFDHLASLRVNPNAHAAARLIWIDTVAPRLPAALIVEQLFAR